MRARSAKGKAATAPARRKKMTRRGKAVEGNPGISRHDDGTFTIRVVITKNTKKIERQEPFKGTLNQAKARQSQLRLDLQREAASALTVNSATDTLEQHSTYWLAHRVSTGKGRPSTIARFDEHLKKFILPYFGSSRLCDIQPMHILNWQTDLAMLRSKHGNPYSIETFKGAWRTLRILMKFACVLSGRKNDNPTDGLSFGVVGNVAKTKCWLTQEQLGRFLHAAQSEDPKWRALLTLLGTTGVRFGEATALRWQDILWQKQTILITRSQVLGKVHRTKTSNDRSAPLTPMLEVALRELQKVAAERDDGLIFYSKSGRYLHNSVTQAPIARCLRRAKLDVKISNHDLRRTVNDLVRKTAGQTVAMSLLGHVTSDMHRHYSNVDAAERLAAVSTALGIGSGVGSGSADQR